MNQKVVLNHLTTYTFEQPAFLGPHVLRLRPTADASAEILDYRLDIEPSSTTRYAYRDSHANRLVRLLFAEPVAALRIAVTLKANLTPVNPFDFLLEPEAMDWPFAYAEGDHLDLYPYLFIEPAGPQVAAFLSRISRQSQPTIDFLIELNRTLRGEIDYLVREEPGTFEPEETLLAGCGSCRDSAWALCHVLRHLGIAARFVSGYLAEMAEQGGEDRIAFHAWTEAYLPGAGWVGLDPSSGLMAGAGHIPLAVARHWQQAAPVSGTASLPATGFDVKMALKRDA